MFGLRFLWILLFFAIVACTAPAGVGNTPAGATATAVGGPSQATSTPPPGGGQGTLPPPSSPTVPQSTKLYAWSYEGLVRKGAVDAFTITLPDGTYRQFWGTARRYVTGGRPEGPYIAVATSRDGLNWTEEGDSGFPLSLNGTRITRLADGRYRAYFGNPLDPIRFGALTSADGKTWQVEPAASLKEPDPACTTCWYLGSDFLVLPDRTYRMLYGEQRAPQATAGGPPPAAGSPVLNFLMSASSKDGLVWQKDPGVVDPPSGPGAVQGHHPRVIALADGTYKMFISVHSAIWSLTSRDGRNWTERKPENVFGADGDVIVLPDGRLRMFVNWRDETLPAGPEVQLMWSYIWQPVSYLLSAPGEVTVSNKTASVPVSVTGVPGTKVSLSATVFLSTLFDSKDLKSPIKVQLSQTSGTVPFTSQLAVSGEYGSTTGPTMIIITGDDGSARVRQLVLMNGMPLPPSAGSQPFGQRQSGPPTPAPPGGTGPGAPPPPGGTGPGGPPPPGGAGSGGPPSGGQPPSAPPPAR